MSEAKAAGLSEPFLFLHVGDQHLTRRDAHNHRDLAAIFAQIARLPAGSFDLVYLPGDIAENGQADEYALFAEILDEHAHLPVHLIPGDHDRQYGAMDAFAAFQHRATGGRCPPVINALDQPPTGPEGRPPLREIPQYYFARDFGAARCLFVDMISAGYGQKGKGLDFRLGPFQKAWLAEEAVRAAREGKTCAVFMHSYPEDLEKKEAAEIAGLFWSAGVRLVEMGHTHYNELGHDGRTTYAAARSVGQNEDGSVGYAVGAIDGGEVSWRFRALDRTAPFVLITCPVDRRLATRSVHADANGLLTVRAMVLSDKPPRLCRCSVDDGPWITMTEAGRPGLYSASVPWPPGSQRLAVEAIHPDWPGYGPDFIDRDVIEPAGPVFPKPEKSVRPGSDSCSLGAWLDKGVRGDQLGPNRAGREW